MAALCAIVLPVLSAGPCVAQTLKDSAGIRVITIVRSEATARRALVEPVLTIGAAEGGTHQLLHRVVGAVRFPNGNIAVALQGSYSVRVFDPSGAHLRTFGRKGSGPDEFEVVGELLRCGPFAVATAPDRRIGYILNPAGERTGQLRLSGNRYVTQPKRVMCSDDWRLLAIGWGAFANVPTGPHRPRVPIGLSDSAGGNAISLGEFQGEERYRHERSDGPRPLGLRLVSALASEWAVIGDGNRDELRLFDRSGRLRRILRLPADLRTFTRADRNAFIEEHTRLLSGLARARANRFYHDLEFPSEYPPYQDVYIDSDSRIWVQRYPRAGREETVLLVIGFDGRYIGDITIPRKLEVFGIKDGYLIARWLDRLGVEYVHVYRIPPLA